MGRPSKTCLRGEKLSYVSEISPALRWDLTWVGLIHSHINNLFLQSEIHHTAAEISLRLDVLSGWDEFSHINSSWSSLFLWLKTKFKKDGEVKKLLKIEIEKEKKTTPEKLLFSQMFFKIGVLENFVKFTGKWLCRTLFLIKWLQLY